MNKTELNKLLSFDALDVAEKLNDGRRDSLTDALGFVLMSNASQIKQSVLMRMEDTPFCCPMEYYLKVVKELGFEIVLDIPFESYGTQEHFYILWNNGMLLTCDTDNSVDRNSAKIYFNYIPENGEFPSGLSGGFSSVKKEVCCGSIDAREAVKHQITTLKEEGKILEKWVETPFLWLLHHGDTKDKSYDFNKINQERINKLPEEIRNAITVK